MKYLLFCVILHVLFLANNVSAKIRIVAQYDDPDDHSVVFLYHQPIELLCDVKTKSESSGDDFTVKWEKDGQLVTEIDDLKRRLSISHNQNTHKIDINRAESSDAGQYSCVLYLNDEEKSRAMIIVESPVYVELPLKINVEEGATLRVVCKVLADPTPRIVWYHKNKTYKKSAKRVLIEEDPETKIPNAVFIIEKVTLEDQGQLFCRGFSKLTSATSDPSGGIIEVSSVNANTP